MMTNNRDAVQRVTY